MIAASLFRASNGREVLRCLADGLRLTQAGTRLRLVGRSALSKARVRLGPEPFRALRRLRVQPVADARTPGEHYRGLRLLAYDTARSSACRATGAGRRPFPRHA